MIAKSIFNGNSIENRLCDRLQTCGKLLFHLARVFQNLKNFSKTNRNLLKIQEATDLAERSPKTPSAAPGDTYLTNFVACGGLIKPQTWHAPLANFGPYHRRATFSQRYLNLDPTPEQPITFITLSRTKIKPQHFEIIYSKPSSPGQVE